MRVLSVCILTLVGVGVSVEVAGWRRWVALCATCALLVSGVADLAGVFVPAFTVGVALNAEWVFRALRRRVRKDAGWVNNVLAVLGLARPDPKS
ncbi:MAG: hypothetical protein H6513_06555 [Acidimicrobiaceae bacterium]|nr:hypothetical protein [Acidimicrobiaceae bacterium]MCO5329321.1 hypothetical protein [Ilumatobacteraceae bacterium]